MFRWNTQKIITDLKKIPLIRDIKVNGPGGDVDSENLVITVRGAPDKLLVCGFVADQADFTTSTPGDDDFEMVELADSSADSRGGLNSDDDNVGQVWLAIRNYFRKQNIQVVDQLKDYF